MYAQSAAVYDAIYAERRNYRADELRLTDEIHARKPDAASLLDVACGTGRHLELLRDAFDVAGVDASRPMLAIARGRLPGVKLVQADMERFALDLQFDAITCLFSSIGYVETLERLHRAIANFARHLVPDGVLIVEPWLSPDEFDDGHVSAEIIANEPTRKTSRVIVSHREGDISRLESRIVIGTAGGIEVIAETHTLRLFSHDQTVGAFQRAGLSVEHDPEGLMGRGLYVGVKSD